MIALSSSLSLQATRLSRRSRAARRRTTRYLPSHAGAAQREIESSVLFDSLAPARLTLRANLRLLDLKGTVFSIVFSVVNSL